MRRTVGIALLGLLLWAGPASAKDMDGQFGVGFHQSLGGVSGLGLKYWIGDFGLLGDLGMNLFSPADGDVGWDVRFGLGGIYNVAKSESANFGIGLLVNVGLAGIQVDPVPPATEQTTETGWQVTIELPMVAEYFFSDHFSIYGQVGLLVNIIGEHGYPQTKIGDFTVLEPEGVGFGLGAGVDATAGFTFYF